MPNDNLISFNDRRGSFGNLTGRIRLSNRSRNRLSRDPNEFATMTKALADAGVDLVIASGGYAEASPEGVRRSLVVSASELFSSGPAWI